MNLSGEVLLALKGWSLERRTSTGSIRLLDSLDLEIRRGAWLAVMGANGSGKSSLIRHLASDDSPLLHTSAIMFQDPDEQIIAATVDRELALGRESVDVAAVKRDFKLEGLGDLDPRLLSAGQKQRLVLAVALGAEPEVLFCDEPTSLQDPVQSAWVLERLDRWRRETGGALITATNDSREAGRADRILALFPDGARSGEPAGILDQPRIRALFSDGPLERAAAQRESAGSHPEPTSPVLDLSGCGCRLLGPGGGFAGVDLAVRPGQRIGITGPSGCGKSTLLAMATGLRAPDQGKVRAAGRDLYGKGNRPQDLDHGRAMLAPQFPEYFFTRTTVKAEFGLDPALAGQDPVSLMEKWGLDPSITDSNPHELSSGQRRRLALGLTLASRRPVLALDEPTAALDGAGRRLVLSMLDTVPEDAALIIASHDAAFLAASGCEIRELSPSGLT